MNASAFKTGLRRVLEGAGFTPHGSSLRRDQAGATVLVSFEKGFGSQWFVSVGFWLHGLGSVATDKVEQAHLYFRLERLVPQHRETVLAAGALDASDQSAEYGKLQALLKEQIDNELAILGTETGLRAALHQSRLTGGLIRKEAREYLAKR